MRQSRNPRARTATTQRPRRPTTTGGRAKSQRIESSSTMMNGDKRYGRQRTNVKRTKCLKAKQRNVYCKQFNTNKYAVQNKQTNNNDDTESVCTEQTHGYTDPQKHDISDRRRNLSKMRQQSIYRNKTFMANRSTNQLLQKKRNVFQKKLTKCVKSSGLKINEVLISEC